MNMTSTTFSSPAARPATRRTVDAPTRVMHWLMVLSFLGAYLTADGERWRLLHVTLGYTLAGLLSFRVVWGLIAPLTLSGYGTYNEWAGEWLEDVHEFFGNALLAVVLAHVALIAALSLLRRKNQVTPMLTGRVEGSGPDLLKSDHYPVAALLLAAVLGFWAWQWQQAPAVGTGGTGQGATLSSGGRDAPARDGAYDGRRAPKHGERHHD